MNMDDLLVLTELLDRPEFRGLWRSRTIQSDGTIEDGWSCTFLHDGNYCEVPYQQSAADAVVEAVKCLRHADRGETRCV
jgi:hypothetical protein